MTFVEPGSVRVNVDRLRYRIWLIKAKQPEGEYVTWHKIAEYLDHPCSTVTLSLFAAGGYQPYRVSKKLLQILDEQVSLFLEEWNISE